MWWRGNPFCTKLKNSPLYRANTVRYDKRMAKSAFFLNSFVSYYNSLGAI